MLSLTMGMGHDSIHPLFLLTFLMHSTFQWKYNQCNCDGDVIVIPLIMGAPQSVSFNGLMFGLTHLWTLCITSILYSKSNNSDIWLLTFWCSPHGNKRKMFFFWTNFALWQQTKSSAKGTKNSCEHQNHHILRKKNLKLPKQSRILIFKNFHV
jgi:hypothetical protein